LSPEQRRGELLNLVRAQAAAVLGYDTPDVVQADRGFIEQGFDSLTAAELAGRLSSVIDRQLPAVTVFDHRAPADLAAHLDVVLRDQPDPGPAGQAVEGGPFNSMFARAIELGRAKEFMDFLDVASRFRRDFVDPADVGHTPDMVQVTSGDTAPALVCVPGFIGMPGPQQFTRFAATFRGSRELTVLQHPGFVPGELLPADIDAVIRLHARTVLARYEGRPFAFVGLSSGGMVAQALAHHLESKGVTPSGVVLLDTFGPHLDHLVDDLIPEFAVRLFDAHVAMGYADNDDWLTAMGRYVAFPWQTRSIAAPIFLVRASEPLIEWTREEDWRTSWEEAESVLDVPGDHFTMMGDYADITARTVDDWLRRRAPRSMKSARRM